MAPQAELIGRTACDQAFERFRATGWNLGEFLAAAEQDAVPVTHDEPELADDELQELNDTQEGRYDPDDRNDSGIPKWPN